MTITEMKLEKILLSYVNVCDIHADRLGRALIKTSHLVSFNEEKLSTLSDIDAAFLEAITSRFAKLQDTCGYKIFPLFLEVLGEDTRRKTFIYILNMFEKFGFIESATFWMDLRQTRNSIAHDYLNDLKKLVIDMNQSSCPIKRPHRVLEHSQTEHREDSSY